MQNKTFKEKCKDYFSCFKLGTKDIATNAIIAALYVALTYGFFFMSYGTPQVRISEFLMILPFFNPSYTIGLTIGCAISNIYSIVSSAYMPLDIIFGSLATLLSCIAVSLCRNMLLSTIFPALFNGFIVAFELTFFMEGANITTEFYFVQFGWVFLGEIIAVLCIGYPIFMIMSKKIPNFNHIINSKQNLSFHF